MGRVRLGRLGSSRRAWIIGWVNTRNRQIWSNDLGPRRRMVAGRVSGSWRAHSCRVVARRTTVVHCGRCRWMILRAGPDSP